MKHQNNTLSVFLLNLILVPLVVAPTIVLAADDKKTSNPFSLSPNMKFNSMEVIKAQNAGVQKSPLAKKPTKPTTTAKVLEILKANEYSYLQVEANNTKIWIAGIKIAAKTGDTIRYVENVTMENFLSKSLNRTFKKLVFVSNVSYE